MIVLKSDRGTAWATKATAPWQLNRAAPRSLDVSQNSPMGRKVGWFAANYYWSSSQNNANNAWAQNFDNGNQDNGNKYNNSLPVRPVRGFQYGT